MVNNRYLYVFVSAGLNDILCQIKQAVDYAHRHNRIIIFDKFHHEITFEFWNIFNIEYPGVQIANFCDIDISKIYRKQLNYKIDYSEKILCYYKPSGGTDSHSLLSYIRLKSNIVKQFYERLDNIGGEYVGIHIRNTDIKSDIDGLLSNLAKRKYLNKIFVSTDDINTLKRFKEIYGDKIYSFSNIIDIGKDKSLHHTLKLDKKIKNTDAILDLLCLGYAKEIYCAPMIFHPSLSIRNTNLLGGYSNLALYLNKNKHLIQNMVSNYIKLS